MANILSSISSALGGNNDFYSPDISNWYLSLPYTFVFNNNGDTKEFPLPINPTNLTVNTNFATNVISTIYGTVEEHTDVRYFDISIKGTTGIAPIYTSSSTGRIGDIINTDINIKSAVTSVVADELGFSDNGGAKRGRKSFAVTGPALGGLFKETVSAVKGVVNAVKSVSEFLTGEDMNVGVFNEDTGYIAFHNFYRFLLTYKKNISNPDEGGLLSGGSLIGSATKALGNALGLGSSKPHPLQFVNYKDGLQYDVAIKNFTLERSADSPLLYIYTITMRGYNLKKSGSGPKLSSQDITAGLGLDGVKSGSPLGKMKKAASKARGVAGTAIGGISSFGR